MQRRFCLWADIDWHCRCLRPHWARQPWWPSAYRPASAQPKGPVTINIVDVAGDLALTQDAIDAYVKKHPEVDFQGHLSPRRRRQSFPAS